VDIEKTIEFILEQQAKTEALLAATADRGARTDARLDRAIRLAVREARSERRKRREMDARWEEKITQLAAAQLVTEEKVQKLSDKIDAIVEMRRNGGNGQPAA
jgi:predicted RNase H-like nuclease (RuvC/YqgF family)